MDKFFILTEITEHNLQDSIIETETIKIDPINPYTGTIDDKFISFQFIGS